MKKKYGYIFGKTIWLVVMIILALIMFYPFVYSFLGALNNRFQFSDLGSLLPIPKGRLEFENFLYAFGKAGMRPLINTITRTTWYTCWHLLIAILLGYVMARYEFKGKRFIFITIICSQVIPSVMTIIPSYLLLSKIPFAGGNNAFGIGGQGILNNSLALYLPMDWLVLLWVFLFMQSMKSMPRAYEEAAEIDGAGFWTILTKVVIPMQKPILAVIAVTTALNTWNDWLKPFMYINDVQKSTLPAYVGMLTSQLQRFSSTAKDYPRLFGLACVAMIPPFVIFLFFQKHIVQGIASTGIKE